MIHGSVPSSCAEVVCLFCGHHTPAPLRNPPDGTSSQRGPTETNSPAVVSGIALIRCRLCGKEAPYSTSEIVTFEPVAKTA